jgi:hypothetical protein
MALCGAALQLLCVPVLAQSPATVGELFTSDAGGQQSVQLAGSGMSVVVGSELSAGTAPATLKLVRGGQVRICPRSGLSVNAGNRGLMLAAGVGAVEIDYPLDQLQFDLVVTPDFNVQLIGPGTYHFALGVNKQGDTCVKPLPGNTSEILLSELLGSSSYKTRADEAALFLGGKLSQNRSLNVDCGCSGTTPVLQAADPPPNGAAPSEQLPGEANAPLPPDQPGQLHVEVDAPFVFNPRASGARPYMVAKIDFSSLPNEAFVQETVDPAVLAESAPKVSVKEARQESNPVQQNNENKDKEKKGFFGRVKGFFGGLFHR